MGNRKERGNRKKIAGTIKRAMMALSALLIAALLVLLFNLGSDVWPFWLIAHRKQIVGLLIFILIIAILLSPILIEATSNTRRLSGPGKTYSGNRLDEWHDELKR